jgi:hypothetical protein
MAATIFSKLPAGARSSGILYPWLLLVTVFFVAAFGVMI